MHLDALDKHKETHRLEVHIEFRVCVCIEADRGLTMVEPAILKAVQGIEQRHVEEANHLSNGIDGEETNNHTLEDQESKHDDTSWNKARNTGSYADLF